MKKKLKNARSVTELCDVGRNMMFAIVVLHLRRVKRNSWKKDCQTFSENRALVVYV